MLILPVAVAVAVLLLLLFWSGLIVWDSLSLLSLLSLLLSFSAVRLPLGE
jgi:hypothetical protein